jgi:quercetin dioxygenase-like cupin family protein
MKTVRNKETSVGLMGRAISLAGLADYQAGAVVSRTVLSKKAGTVTVFSFDKGQGLSAHSAPFDAMVWILDGTARITISGKALRAKAGDMVVMPAGEPHALKAVHPFKMALVMIKS